MKHLSSLQTIGVGLSRLILAAMLAGGINLGHAASPAAQAASIVVNRTVDGVDANPGDGVCETAPGNGRCTLRAAVQETNALAGLDTILLPAGIYTLVRPGAEENLAATGDLDIRDHLLISGSGADETIIDGNQLDRVFHIPISIGVSFSISGVTVRHGANVNSGAGIFNEGGGTLIVESSYIQGNTSLTNGGGIDNLNGQVTINNSTISGNKAQGDENGNGGGMYNNGGTLYLSSSTISGNQATLRGGGISSSGALIIDSSTIHDNLARQVGYGGGLHIYASGTLTLTNSAIYGNHAVEHGGGISNYSDSAAILNSAIYNNTADKNGGGIYNLGTLLMTNVTLSGNSIPAESSAYHRGGGLYNSGSSTLAYTTIYGNSGFFGGGIYHTGTGSTILKGTLLANNLAGSTPNNCAGTITSQGYNLSDDTTCGLTGVGDQQGEMIDPQLGPLQDNGGPTFTHALPASSPAVDRGGETCTEAQGNPLYTDQRGYFRPVDGVGTDGPACDVGAYEYSVLDLSVSNDDGQLTAIPGTGVSYTIIVTNEGSIPALGAVITDTFAAAFSEVSWTCAAEAGSTCAAPGGSGDILMNLDLAPAAAVRFEVSGTVKSTATGNLKNTVAIAPPRGIIDFILSNNIATDIDQLLPHADLSLVKSDSQDPVVPGAEVQYTLSVANSGPSMATQVVVTDTLPANTSFLGVTGNGWVCGESDHTMTCSRQGLSVGNAPAIYINLAAPVASGMITNTALIGSQAIDTDPADNRASETTWVTDLADLSLEKVVEPGQVIPGGTLMYSLSISNAGPGLATSVVVTDTLPSGLLFQAAQSPDWDCNEFGGQVVCHLVQHPVGAAPPLILTVIVNEVRGVVTNTATVQSDVMDPDPSNNTASATFSALHAGWLPLVFKALLP